MQDLGKRDRVFQDLILLNTYEYISIGGITSLNKEGSVILIAVEARGIFPFKIFKKRAVNDLIKGFTFKNKC